jgi:hypothetical protein
MCGVRSCCAFSISSQLPVPVTPTEERMTSLYRTQTPNWLEDEKQYPMDRRLGTAAVHRVLRLLKGITTVSSVRSSKHKWEDMPIFSRSPPTLLLYSPARAELIQQSSLVRPSC